MRDTLPFSLPTMSIQSPTYPRGLILNPNTKGRKSSELDWAAGIVVVAVQTHRVGPSTGTFRCWDIHACFTDRGAG